MSAVYTVDIHQQYIDKNSNQTKLVWVGRIAILVFALVAYFMSIFIPGLLVTIGLVALSGTAQVIVPTVGALAWKKSTTAGAIAGLLVGIGVLCLITFVPGVKAPWGLHSGLFALILNTIAFVVVSLVTPQRDAALLAKIDDAKAEYSRSYS
jgi:SSS family solute:Na+ symporter